MADRRDDKDPYLGFRFRVDIDGISVASFKSVSIPDLGVEVKQYREGMDDNTKRLLAGLTTSTEITLTKGISNSMDLWNWYNDVVTKGAIPNRKNLSITVVDEELQDGPSWNVIESWPSTYNIGELAGDNDEHVIQTMTIVHEGCVRAK